VTQSTVPYYEFINGLPLSRQPNLHQFGDLVVKKIILKTIAMLLWAITAVIAGYEVFVTRYIVTNLYFLLLNRYSIPINVLERLSATGVGNIGALFMAIIAIVIVVGGFDYHWSYGGEAKSFKLFALTFIFQFIVIGLHIFVQ
jgi:hypothetical protein